MTFLIFLPLVLIVITGLIVWFTVVPFVAFLLKQQEQLNNNVQFPKLPLPPPSPPMDVCAHGTNNQTLDGGIICLPKDQANLSKLNSQGRDNI
jgi:hypothetical protein